MVILIFFDRKVSVKKIFLIIFLFLSFNTKADIYADKFTECMLNNTSDRDKIILVKWMFVGMAEHPILKREFPIPENQKVAADMAVADYISYIIGSICLEETKEVIKYEGEEAFAESFEYLGEIAMMLLIQDENVIRSFEGYLKYVDPSIFLEFLEN